MDQVTPKPARKRAPRKAPTAIRPPALREVHSWESLPEGDGALGKRVVLVRRYAEEFLPKGLVGTVIHAGPWPTDPMITVDFGHTRPWARVPRTHLALAED